MAQKRNVEVTVAEESGVCKRKPMDTYFLQAAHADGKGIKSLYSAQTTHMYSSCARRSLRTLKPHRSRNVVLQPEQETFILETK